MEFFERCHDADLEARGNRAVDRRRDVQACRRLRRDGGDAVGDAHRVTNIFTLDLVPELSAAFCEQEIWELNFRDASDDQNESSRAEGCDLEQFLIGLAVKEITFLKESSFGVDFQCLLKIDVERNASGDRIQGASKN